MIKYLPCLLVFGLLTACTELPCENAVFYTEDNSIYRFDTLSKKSTRLKVFDHKGSYATTLTRYKDNLICEVSEMLFEVDLKDQAHTQLFPGRKPLYFENHNTLFYYDLSGDEIYLVARKLDNKGYQVAIDNYGSSKKISTKISKRIRKVITNYDNKIFYINKNGFLSSYEITTKKKHITVFSNIIPIYYDQSTNNLICYDENGDMVAISEDFIEKRYLRKSSSTFVESYSRKCDLTIASQLNFNIFKGETISLVIYDFKLDKDVFNLGEIFARDAIWWE